MIPSHERRVEELFHRAVFLPESEREAWLAVHCPDLALRTEVEVLLRADGRVAPEFLERVGAASGTWLESGERLGDYTIRERLGQGGMGVVYLAREAKLERDVALKIVRPDLLLFGHGRERLRREVDAIARLKHANILPVYSAGEEAGVPFFTMEFVEGCTLAEVLGYLNRRRPAELTAAALSGAVEELSRKTVGERPGRRAQAQFGSSWTGASFRIALAVAEALEHAHERGILHRDVKPSNVMLTRDGRVLLLDFGLAASSEVSHLTLSGFPVGTLPYMSPEQIRGDSKLVGERSDVYALGVMLFELLTLRAPYLAPNAEVLRQRILEANPPPIRSLNPQVPWDAETVCLTAMDRDPARRYDSAGALAEDLANVIEHRPIRARRPGPLLRARRFVERHPVASVAASLGFLLLAGATAFGVVQASNVRALRTADQAKETALGDAKTALARKDEINRILSSMIRAPDPWEVDPINPVTLDTKVVEVLDRAREQLLEEGRELDPEVELEVGGLLGNTYASLVLLDRAEPLLLRACDLSKELYGKHSLEHFQALHPLVGVRLIQRRFAEARALVEEALAGCDEGVPHADPLLEDLALCHRMLGDQERAEELYRRQLELCDPDDWAELAEACTDLGSVQREQGALEEAAELIERALELRERNLPQDHAITLFTRNELGVVWAKQRRFAEAAGLFEELARDVERTLGEDHVMMDTVRGNLAWMLSEVGRFPEAEEHARILIDRAANLDLPPGHPAPLMARVHLARSLAGQGRLLEAAAAAAESMDFVENASQFHRSQALGVRQEVSELVEQAAASLAEQLEEARSLPGGPDSSISAKTCELASLQRALGRSEDALIVVDEALRELEAESPESKAELGALQRELGLCLMDLEVHDEAEAALRQALVNYRASLGIEDPRTQALIQDLVRSLDARDLESEAQEYRRLLSVHPPSD